MRLPEVYAFTVCVCATRGDTTHREGQRRKQKRERERKEERVQGKGGHVGQTAPERIDRATPKKINKRYPVRVGANTTLLNFE